jgi:pimeloyl-ACP methyl ester carboxylesterase
MSRGVESLPALVWPCSSRSMPTIRIGDLEVHVHEWLPGKSGPGPAPVVCLPSGGLSGMQWRKLARSLSERQHRVLAPDLIGHGESHGPHVERPFEARHDVAVVGDTIDMCRSERIHLVGHSYGGRIGLAVATMRPESIRSIALFEPTCFGVLHSLEHAHEGVPSIDDDRFAASEASLGRFINYWSVRSSGTHCPTPDSLERLGAIPMLVLSGGQSTRAGRRCCEVLAEMMPNCRHVELPMVGHMGPLLASEAVNALLLEHIDAVEAGWTQAD